ncbi:MAG: ATP-binding cassette domain-containing protein [Pseudomonadota bacterium]
MQSERHIVETKGLTKTFGDLTAVDGISFHVNSGECFGLLGPNGAGKTSTIRMMYGFSPITSGTMKVFGLDAARDLRRIKYRLGVCQQEDSLDPDLTVRQNLEIFARYFDISPGKAREKTAQLLKFIGLEHKEKSRVNDLSGGMKRRLMVARALLNDPELVILDEPTTGLDPQSRHLVWEKLDDLKARGLSILLTTHYMDEASRLCDRLVIMDKGRILVEGRPRKLIDEYVGRNVIEISRPPQELKDFVRQSELNFEESGQRMVIYTDKDDGLFNRISENYCAEGCILRMASLEDVFLKLTGRGLRE